MTATAIYPRETLRTIDGFSVQEWRDWLSAGYPIPAGLSLDARRKLTIAAEDIGYRHPIPATPTEAAA